jgi:hypothetical protein
MLCGAAIRQSPGHRYAESHGMSKGRTFR